MISGFFYFAQRYENEKLIAQQIELNPEYEAFYFQKSNQLQDEINYLHENIQFSNSITIYRLIHNPFKTASGSKYIVSIIANVGHRNSYRNLKKWQKRPVPKGYEIYNDRILNAPDNSYFIEDITQDKNIYVAETKATIDNNTTTSLYGILVYKRRSDIDEAHNVYYLLAIAYNKNPLYSQAYVKKKAEESIPHLIKIFKQWKPLAFFY